MANYSLVDLVPQYDTFTDRDEKKTVYNVRTVKMMSAVDLARLLRFQREARVLETVDIEKVEPEEVDAMMKTMITAVNTFFSLVVLDIPPERIEKLEMNEKLGFMQWWEQRQQEINPPPNRKTRRVAQSSRQKQSSRASSRSTASTRKGS